MKRDTQAGLILLVEDNRSLSEVVGEYFESKGFGVDYAGDGMDGYRLATKNSYDVIVLDLNLPRMDGLQVCRKLREDGMLASAIVVFIRTNQHRIDQAQYRGDELEPLDPPTDDAQIGRAHV